MTKADKRKFYEFLKSEAGMLSYRIEQMEIYCEKKREENPDDPFLVTMKKGLKRDNDRLAKYSYFMTKLLEELRA